MSAPPTALRKALTWAELLPSILAGGWVVSLFTAAVLLAREYSAPIQAVLQAHPRLAIVVFIVTSVVAVLVPFLTNLPLVPLAVLAWGPAWTASLLLSGWVAGAALSFVLGRYAGRFILRHFPSAKRHANIDRLIHPRHRLASLIMLRMTFPVDVLSYALGMFSRSTTLTENVVSTALGAAPFAVLFALFPALSATTQFVLFAICTLVFGAHVLWVLRRTSGTDSQDSGGVER
ncbi:MAG: TVP38/TMEM64 family protein [Burkholderiales bacterium]|jgi:uncharacterized membrane protein YdjX (TVP38/TMEM64 family)|nr:TVP38/TMEM64 family protein [Burkholderiales bacterium]